MKLQSDEIAIKALLETYKTSINRADALLGKTIFLSDEKVNFTHPRGHEKGWEGIEKGIYEMFAREFTERDLKSFDEAASIFGDMAVLEFYWVFDAIFKGAERKPLQTEGRETQVLKKFGKGWKIVHIHYSGMPVTGEGQGF